MLETHPVVANAAPRIDFEKYTLANGLEVILSEDHRLPIVAVNIWYHVGPANERRGLRGFAHLFEHMMFQGSKHVGENQTKVLQAAGATGINGTTGFDRTNYFETMPAEKLELALWLESDRMAFLLETLTARNLANQRDVVRNERRERENTPYSLVEEELYRQLFPEGHPYHASIIGSHADIESAGLQDVRDFCRQFYVPNNASLALVGDFDSIEAKRLVERYFGPIAAGRPVPKPDVKTSSIVSAKRMTVTDRVELPRIYKAWLTAPIYQQGDAASDVLAQILGGSRSSRLYQKLVYQKQIAQDVSAGQQSMMLGSVFMLRATAKPGVALAELEKALDDEVLVMQSIGPTSEELASARNGIQANFVFGLEQVGGLGGVADRLNSYNHYIGHPGYIAEDWARYEAVSLADVQRAAEALTDDTSLTVLAVPGPKVLNDVPKRTDVEPEVEPDKVPTGIAWRRDPPKARRQSLPELAVPVSFKLANGLRVLFLQQCHIPAVFANLIVLGGSGANPAELPGLASFTAAMLSRGTSRRSQSQIVNDFERLGARWGTQSSSDASVLSMRVLRKNVDAAFEIVSDVALHPVFRSEEIERVRQERLVSIAQQGDNPEAVAHQELLDALYGAKHPYGQVDIGTRSSNEKIDRDSLQDFYSTASTPHGAALIVVGDLNSDEVGLLAEKYFGDWSSNFVAPQAPRVHEQTSRCVLIIDRPNSPQTHLLIGQIGAPRNHPDFVPIEMMNLLLGGMFSSRINQNLREVHGYTYRSNSRFAYRRSPGPFLISTAVRTDATAQAVAEIFHEIDKVRRDVASHDEVAAAAEALKRSMISRFDTSGSSAASIGELFIHDLDLHYFRELLAQISQVNAADIRRVAKEHLDPASMVVVAVGDKSKIKTELNQLGLGPVRSADRGN